MKIDIAGKVLSRSRLSRWRSSPSAWADEVLGVKLTGYQCEVLDALPEKKRVALRGPHGLGKAGYIGTMLPTPCGWSTIEDIQVGQEVFDQDGKPCLVVGKSPVFTDSAYEVEFANGAVEVVHGEHEWNVVDINTRPKGVKDWRDHWAVTRTHTTAWLAERLRTPSGQLRWRVPAARALELPTAALPIDPYTLGVWLGDGVTSNGLFTLNRADSEHIVKRIPGGHFVTSGERENSRAYRVPGFMTALRSLGVLGDKRIPMTYLRASVEQRRELVRGLFDSDGYRQAGGSDEITLTCKPLADGVAELLRSLGLVVRVREGRAKLNGQDYGPKWRIAARFDFNPYYLQRYGWEPRGQQGSRHTQHTIVGIRRVADAPTQCIEVDSPSHLYLTGQDMIPTHNSFMGSILVLWFATTRDLAGEDWKVITTASAWRHLEVYLWPEIHKWARKIDFDVLGRAPFKSGVELLDRNLKLTYGAATPVASNQPERIEGAHARQLLYLLDEAKIVPPETWDSIEGAFSNAGDDTEDDAYAFAMSTPGPPSGRFYEIHKRAAGYEDWWVRHVTIEDAIASGRISAKWAQQRKLQWGESSAIYQNRVRGEFHASDEESVIPLAWLEAAIERWHDWDRAGRPEIGRPEKRWTGIDVGRGGDETIFAHRDGHVITLSKGTRARDTMKTVAQAQGFDGRAIVDVIGVGAGVYDRLREAGARPLAYAGSAAAKGWRDSISGKYGAVNVRSAAYWNLRELLDPSREGILCLPPDDLMVSDLTTPRWEITSGAPPKIKIETKEKVVERLGRSPDRGDAIAFVMWADRHRGDEANFAEPRGIMPVTALNGFGRR